MMFKSKCAEGICSSTSSTSLRFLRNVENSADVFTSSILEIAVQIPPCSVLFDQDFA